MLAPEGRDRLRGGDGVALDERQRGRALEQLDEVVGPGVLGGELGEPVLDDSKRRVGLGEPRPQLGGLGDADPAVVDREDRLGVAQRRRHLLDQCCFLLSVHRL